MTGRRIQAPYLLDVVASQPSAFAHDTQAILPANTETSPAADSICVKPKVRKEWRALTYSEKNSWMQAVNVRPR